VHVDVRRALNSGTMEGYMAKKAKKAKTVKKAKKKAAKKK
jgi:hypothetical protein